MEATLALGVIGLALVIGATGLLLPWLVAHPERVEAFLAKRLERPVAIGRVEGHWNPAGPVFTLHDVALGGGSAFRVGRAELAIDFYAGLKRDVSFSEFRVVGVSIDAVREPDGRWRVAQFGDVRADQPDARFPSLGLGSFSLREARLSLRDAAGTPLLAEARLDGRLVDDGGALRFGGVLRVANDAEPARFACRLADDGAGRCHVAARAIDPAAWLGAAAPGGIAPVRGEVDLAAWLDLDPRGLARARVELATRALVLRGIAPVVLGDGDAIEPRHAPADFSGGVRWQREDGGWRLDLEEDRGGGPLSALTITARGAVDARRYALSAPRLELERLVPLLALSSRTPPAFRSFAWEGSPRGALVGVDARYGAGERALAARVEGLTIAAGARRPGLGRLSGALRADGDAVVFVADRDQALVYDHPAMFRAPIAATLARGTFAAIRTPAGWRVEASDFALAGEGFGLGGSAVLVFDGGRPSLDTQLTIAPGTSVPGAKRFWPVGVMKRRAVDWLDRALESGVLLSGVAVIRGDLDDWPFRAREGRFEARAEVAAATLAFHREWPDARIESADVAFVDAGMDIVAHAGEVLGNAVSRAHARIEDFQQNVLGIEVDAEGAGEDLMRLLRASPIARRYGTHLIGLDVGGRGEVAFSLALPLKDEAAKASLDGRVRLGDADLADAKYAISLERANGTVRFNNDGFAADDLTAQLAGDPVLFSIAVGAFTSDPARLAEASLRGELPVASVLHAFDAIVPLASRMPGRSEWTLELTVPRDDAPKTLALRSDLVGTALALPAPLAKPADSALPARIDITLPALGGRIDASLGGVVAARIQLPGPERELAADLAFGGDAPRAIPDAGFALHGTVGALDLGGWGGLLGAGADGGAVPLDADLALGALLVGGRRFEDVRIAFEQSGTQHLAVIAGPAVAGRIVVPRGASRLGVTAEFERLHLPEADDGALAATIDPASLPAIHFWAKDLRLGAAQLGEARIEAAPHAQGLRFDLVETKSPNLEMRARGDWTRASAQGPERSTFEIDFTAQSLGRMLDAFGYAGMIEDGQTYARLAGSWPGAPTKFSLAAIDGTLEAKVGKGRILDVEPGAGRFFGLLSLQSLPRRLSLDFSDFFKSGLSFDSIVGTFILRDGNAHTEDLVLKGPAAEIEIDGRTGLAQRDYDQRIEVTPRVGGVLPVVGALAAGPAGAAAGLVAGMLPLGQVARAEYRVRGSWDDPEIELLARARRGG